ncbi:cyclopentanone -monooxygenase [Moniliophthora roreri MCA 2997]|uniref:Cyclopentanone-monooxygenase n=1 Tax=Moniliophthora roreri (strain MCA 2997) TaxID=1381753 RepID=V2XAM2_MONRO|nr:cyclopentanone -monooxygenase [Moniliophthora roreri MCA 2997]
MSSNTQSNGREPEFDALIVGAGFGGVYMLHNLRKAGLSVKVLEAGKDMGGVWYWNTYPGARVDSDLPLYQLSDEELWKGYNWKEKFPASNEIIDYFHYVDKKLDLSRDIQFNTQVTAAQWDSSEDRWIIQTEKGEAVRARYLLLCTGIGSKPYTPSFKGLESFKGVVHHTAGWPEGGVDFKGKRVGVIGTGATGVQVIQEVGPVAGHLTVFQRTPNFALPMNQKQIDEAYQTKLKELYPAYFNRRPQTFGGFYYDIVHRDTLSVSPEERILYWEDIWAAGGFRFWVGNYGDIFTSQAANDEAYAFWRKKVRERLTDPRMQEKLAPTIPPHPFGTKRPSLEQNYYEIFNQPNVTLVDVNESPIDTITEKGVKTKDGAVYELDILLLATGYDMVTGGITQIDVKGTDGVLIGDKWNDGVYTYLGMMTANYPNMFFTYGPQGPTAFCNGPSCTEIQGQWITNLIKHAKSKGITHIVPTRKAEEDWRTLVHDLSNLGLWGKAKSWYMGANIPGKKVEPLNFTGGVPMYASKLQESAEKGYEGLEMGTVGA